MRDLIPTTEEHNGMRRFIYRSVFPVTFYVTGTARFLDIICTVEPMKRDEILSLLRAFGFADTLEITVERSGVHVTFCQELIVVPLPPGRTLDTRPDSMVQYEIARASAEKASDREPPGAGEEGDADMCCRYFIDDHVDEFAHLFEEASASSLAARMVAKLGKPFRSSGEINPSDIVPVIARNKKGEVRAFPMVWGFAPSSSPPAGQPARRSAPLFNARVETASEKAAFSEAWASHRCVVPASYFFEWGPPPASPDEPVALAKNGKARYVIQPKGQSVTWLAGLYRTENRNGLAYPSFTILTRDSAGEMTGVHERMPVMLPAGLVEAWTDPSADPARIVRCALTDLCVEIG